ncbi:unnamed protein product [Rhizoctonia solani]|uniref:Thioredoxin domain-containing protein n=1 Tax=Rhizoctonia solani TaxID=456999 RepID=A0A8H3I4L4_9AGAM|nr:unnamed protein product [Rhizoctonia solani]
MILRPFIILSSRPLAATRPPPKFSLATTSSGPTFYQKRTMSAQSIVDAALAPKDGKKRIVIFSKSYCPYCLKAKAQIESFKGSLSSSEKDQVEVDIFELDERDDGSAIQDYLHKKNGQRTVPNIYIGKEHIGGSSDLAPYSNDKIKKILFAV